MNDRTSGRRPRGPAPRAVLAALAAGAALLLATLAADPAWGEYGDVVINNHSDKAGMRPVVFPHWFHRVRYTCKVCHADLGFRFKAGGNDINMVKIIDGQFCGACHNGSVAWSIENCNLCHSAKPNTPTQVHESTVQSLVEGRGGAALPPAAAAGSIAPGGVPNASPVLVPGTATGAPRR